MIPIEYLRGRVVGAAILTLFGFAWCLIALATWDAHPRWSIPAAAAATIALLVLCVQRILALRKIPSAEDPVAEAKGKRAGKWFGIIFGAEGLLIGLCSMILQHFGLSDWIPIAIAGIVGVHFLPLARLFEVPLYYWTGALCVLDVLACLAIHDADMRVLCASLGMTAVLWMSALVVVVKIHPAQQQA